jgi:hypothetical protein
MTEQQARQTKFVVFDEASTDDERMAAVLISKDAETGALKAHVKAGPGRSEPDPEIVAALVQATEIANL